MPLPCRLLFCSWLLTSAAFSAPPVDDHTDPTWYRTASGEKKPIQTVEDWALRRREIVARLEQVMGPLPDRTKWPAAQVRVLERTELPDGIWRQKIQYVTDSNDRPVKAWVFLPKPTLKTDSSQETDRRAAVLCLHQTIGIGKDEPAGLGGNPDRKSTRLNSSHPVSSRMPSSA